jgi:hypothetical protein
MDGNQILPIALASVPTMLTVLVGILINNSRLSDVNVRISELRSTMDERIGEMGSGLGGRITELRSHMDSRFNEVDRRFEEMKDLWRSELHRVEEVLDARLKHIEER